MRANLAGRRFGKLTAMTPGPRRGKRSTTTWDCLCDCGLRSTVDSACLTSGNTKSCGCGHYKFNDLTGKKFFRWTVIGARVLLGAKSEGKYTWMCRCDCGQEKRVKASSLRCGVSKSCGCWAIEARKVRPYEALYNLMMNPSSERIRPPNTLTYEEFIGFISTCQRCHYCLEKVEWTQHNLIHGARYNLDRKDSDLGYSVENCVVCCWRCNYRKGGRCKFTYEEFWKSTQWMRDEKLSIESFGVGGLK